MGYIEKICTVIYCKDSGRYMHNKKGYRLLVGTPFRYELCIVFVFSLVNTLAWCVSYADFCSVAESSDYIRGVQAGCFKRFESGKIGF